MIDRIELHYRLPHEFYGFGNDILKAIGIWAFHYWKDTYCDVYEVIGIRIFGVEICGKTSI